jgi:hypothetical protein
MSKVDFQNELLPRSPGLRKEGSGARKTQSRPSIPKESAKRLIDEIDSLLPELDEEGLVLLLEQARTRRLALEEARTICRSSIASAQDAETELKIGRCDDGSTYYVVAGATWKLFSADEIAALVRIARNEEAADKASQGLFSWLHQERRDVLADLRILDSASGRLPELLELLRSNFPVRSPRRP